MPKQIRWAGASLSPMKILVTPWRSELLASSFQGLKSQALELFLVLELSLRLRNYNHGPG